MELIMVSHESKQAFPEKLFFPLVSYFSKRERLHTYVLPPLQREVILTHPIHGE